MKIAAIAIAIFVYVPCPAIPVRVDTFRPHLSASARNRRRLFATGKFKDFV